MDKPTPILADNHGAVRLAMKQFILLQWTDDKSIDFANTSTDENYCDSLRKSTGRTKFYEHTDVFMGRRKPAYAAYIDQSQSKAHIINYVSVSTCRTNPLTSLLRSKSNSCFDGLDYVSVGKCM
jgi:hypothetical protein